jgi:hypothetical protein
MNIGLLKLPIESLPGDCRNAREACLSVLSVRLPNPDKSEKIATKAPRHKK